MTEEIKSALELALKRSNIGDQPGDKKPTTLNKIDEMVDLPDVIRDLRKKPGIMELDIIPNETDIPYENRVEYGMLIALEGVREAYKKKARREEVRKRNVGQYL